MRRNIITYSVMFQFTLPMVLLLTITSCANNDLGSKNLLRSINDPENGLVKTKSANHLVLTAKYLPANYLALKESKITSSEHYDSLFKYYSGFKTFLLTISPDSDESDLMFYKITNKAEYKERVHELNFNMSSFISLKTTNNEYFPVLHSLENTYELSKKVSLYLVFAADVDHSDLLTASKLDLVFYDELFDTGISHFIFNKEQLDVISRLRIKQDV